MIALLAAALVPALPAAAGPYVLADIDTGRVIDQSEATRPWYPASLTKLMTAYVVLEAVRAGRIGLDTPIVYSARAQGEPPAKMGLPVGQVLTVDNALKMMLVKSANDIAVALAEGVDGSVETFAVEMNATARKLGMANSHFVNPNGLHDPEHVSSARDIALLARAIQLDHPEYARFFGLQSLKLGKRVIRGYNMLLGRYPGANGMKTGFVCPSGFNITGTATRGGTRLVAVVLGAHSAVERAETAARLLEKGFQPTAWIATIGPRSGPVLTQLPASGYSMPIDIREEICSPRGRKKRFAAASESEGADDAADPKTPGGRKGRNAAKNAKPPKTDAVIAASDSTLDTDKQPPTGAAESPAVVQLAAAMKAEKPEATGRLSLLGKTVIMAAPEPVFLGPKPENPTTAAPTVPVYAATADGTADGTASPAAQAGALALAPGVPASDSAIAAVASAGKLRGAQPIGRVPLPRPKP